MDDTPSDISRRRARPRAMWLASTVLWMVAVLGLAWALHHPTSLFFDLGWGDSLAAGRQFEGDWWRYEVRDETAFRWSGTQAKIESPVLVFGPDVRLEWRGARPAPGTARVAIAAAGRTVATWEQRSDTAWHVGRAHLGAHAGALAVDVHASRTTPRPHGVALDWVRVGGADWVWPTAVSWGGILCVVAVVPATLVAVLRQAWPVAFLAPVLTALLGVGIAVDTAGAVWAFSIAGPRAIAAVALMLGIGWVAGRLAGSSPAPLRRTLHHALGIPAVLTVLALLALSSPRYHYPDVDTHGRFLSGIRRAPSWAVDPRPYQQAVRAWTRVLDGERVGFPYSSAFHVLSWPLAAILGDVGAITTLACGAVATSLMIVFMVGSFSGLSPPGAMIAQGLFAALPVVSSRLTLALWPSLLGQCVESGLLALVMARAVRLDAARDVAFWTLSLVAVQASYVGELLNVSALVFVAACAGVVRGRPRWAARLVACQVVAGMLVVVGQHWYFVRTLVTHVIPAAGNGGGGDGAPLAMRLVGELHELAVFYGGGAVLLAVGLASSGRMSGRVRAVLGVATGAAVLLALSRALAPALLGDAKVVELLALPAAVVMAWGLVVLWERPWRGRPWAVAGTAVLIAWSAAKAWTLYATHAMVAML